MYDPRGVYVRRRVGALVAAVVAMVALIWLIDALIGDDEPVVGVAASASPAQAPPSSGPSTAVRTSATASASASPSPRSRTPEQVPADPSAPCPDTSVRLRAETGERSYQVGRRPLLRLVVVNAGPVPCTYDLGRSRRELVVTSRDGKTRLWSSNDCYFGADAPEPTVLEPGMRNGFEVRWAGRTSAPGCPVRRDDVPAGDYRVVPRLGPLTGDAAALTITR
ncbi:hypothetical protein [Actinokineospora fastidiosa]|uniref:Uncharacterized protein n=1 Tax=Actinokineospora fastidiosa TaxID=1816 RepID=A0A918L6Y3_9PSEU|nr:hypothetical protein [Actinokineospora fastidiosa]GGS16558.1 hypothetical protein GCM10010171_06020 [Actinokineospora fastidiosa]